MAVGVGFERHGGIAVLTIDNPPVNALSGTVRQGLIDRVGQAAGDEAVSGIVIIGGGRAFIAGADIKSLGGPPASPPLSAVAGALENAGKPVIAAISGAALGGGLEVALACDYRLATNQAVLGLPEVKIGVFPGGGGTQRLPRLIGLEAALGMIVSGETVGADRALSLGLIDEVAGDDLRGEAFAYAEKLIASRRPLRRISALDFPREGDVAEIFARARKTAARRARGQLAPPAAIDSVERGLTLPFDAAIARDAEAFQEIRVTPQAAAMRHAFLAEREAVKIPDIPRDTAIRAIESVGILGAGTMGVGIAMAVADGGLPVRLVEVAQDALDRGMAMVQRNYGSMVKRGRLSETEMAARLALIKPSLAVDDLAQDDLVIEAVFEKMAVKLEVFARLDGICKPGAILATNSSSLDIDEIAAATSRPQDVLGLHFFSPANVMKLLEVVRAAQTAKDVVASAMKLAKRLGKVGVLAGVCPGFVANRSRAPMFREAVFLVEEGASPQQVDRVLYEFGMPMGPLAVGDLAGLDIGWRIRQSQASMRRREDRYPHLADRLCELGRFGLKTGSGWYRYDEGNRTPLPDLAVDEITQNIAQEQGITRRDVGDDEILTRCLYAAINEGAKILQEGKALRAGDIDVMWNNGFGFPRYRGGLMYYADEIGLSRVLAQIEAYHKTHGALWEPAALLVELAAEGRRFCGPAA
ncbi:MAG: 3-hydroxyacyl-CoA dehydrogenase NAD-binding domain-containing protein [Alphaproteobacteria bacterium]